MQKKVILIITLIVLVGIISAYYFYTKSSRPSSIVEQPIPINNHSDLQKLNCFKNPFLKMQSDICSIYNTYIESGVTEALERAKDSSLMMVQDGRIELIIEMDSISAANSLTDEMLNALDIQVRFRQLRFSDDEIWAWIPIQSLLKLSEKYPSIRSIRKPSYAQTE